MASQREKELRTHGTFPCPFKGCTEVMPSDRSLRAHLRAHRSSTPLKCQEKTCSKMFGTLSERNDHVRQAHMDTNVQASDAADVGNKITEQIGDDGRFDDSMILNSNTKKSSGSGSSSTPAINLAEDDEIREIAENAAYLVSQLRDALSRSDVLAYWNDNDVRNLHQWGVWVENSVNELDEKEHAKLKEALQTRNVNISGLFSAEQAVMYALLGDSNLDNKRLEWILQSIAECADRPNPYQAFVEVAVQCVYRNRHRHLFDSCQHHLQVLPTTSSLPHSSSTVRDVHAEAKAYLLAQRILDCRAVPKQLNVDDVGWSYIMLWCAHFVLKQAATSLNRARNFWANVRHAASNEAIWSVPHHVMSHVCHHDFIVMDRYLASLLLALSKGNDRAAEASRRIVSLIKTQGRVGWLTTQIVKKFTRLTGIGGLLHTC